MIYCMYFSVYHIQYHTSNFSTSTHNVSREKKIIRSTRMCKYKLKFYDSIRFFILRYIILKSTTAKIIRPTTRDDDARDAFRLTFEFFLKYNYIYGKRKKDKTFLKETTLN